MIEERAFTKEKPVIAQFLSERTRMHLEGYTYLSELMGAYRGWREKNQLPVSRLSVSSFSRALPERFERKLMNRGRHGLNPARAIVGLVLR